MFTKTLLFGYLIPFLLLLIISWNHRYQFLMESEISKNGTGLHLSLIYGAMLVLFVWMMFMADKISWRWIFGAWLVILIVLFLAWPFTNLDPAAYLVGAKNWQEYGINPMREAYNSVSSNSWLRLLSDVHWIDRPSPYGPLFFLLVYPIVAVSNSYVVSLYIYKFLILLIYLGLVRLWFLFQKRAGTLNKRIGVLFLYNPAILYFLLFEAHNEILILVSIIAMLLMLYQKKVLAAVGFLTTTTLIKINFILLWPILWFKGGRFNLPRFISTGSVYLITVSLFWHFIGPTLESFLLSSLFMAENCLYSYSPINIFLSLLNVPPLIVGSILEIVVLYRYLWVNYNPSKYIFWSLMVLYFVATGWLAPWYLTIPICIASLINEKKYQYLALALTIYSFGILVGVYL